MSQSLNIKLDYRFDLNGFFDNPDARSSLEKAAETWENLIQEDLPAIPEGIEFGVLNPSNGERTPVNLSDSIDDLLIFVGAEATPFGGNPSLPHSRICSCRFCCPPPTKAKKSASPPSAEIEISPLAQATFTGTNIDGTIFQNRINGSNFTPWAGSISFNDSPTFSDGSTAEWFFDTTPETEESIPNNAVDFFSTALHEIGHVLGIGTASIFQDIGRGGNFDGENTLNVTEQMGVPLTSDLSHIDPNFTDNGENPLMEPVVSGRTFPTEAELAMLADIGWEIDGFTPQGEIPPLATNDNDTIRGTILSDVIRGLDGNDTIRSNRGNDFVFGGKGDDELFGEEGNDHLSGEDGEDELFGEEGNDYLLGRRGVDLLIGEEGRDVLLGGEDNDQLQGETENDVLFGEEGEDVLFAGIGDDWLDSGTGDDELQGGEGNDRLIGGGGNDSLFGQEGIDRFIFHLGNGKDRINDFDVSNEVIEIDPEFGFTAEEILAAITKPFSNVSRLNLSPEDQVDVFHESTTGTPLTLENIEIIDSSEAIQIGSLEDNILNLTGEATIALSGTGDDLMNFSAFSGNSTRHRLYGGEGDDIIFANQGDRLFGGSGNDFLNASLGNGNNRLYGGEGNDRLVGGNNDTLIGGKGEDWLQAGVENRLFGGEGRDRFVLESETEATGESVIADFNPEIDLMILTNLSPQDLSLVQDDQDTLLTTTDTTLARLLNLESDQIGESNLIFDN